MYKEVEKREVLKYLDFGNYKKFKMSGGRGAVMLLNNILELEEGNNTNPEGKNSIGTSMWSVDIEGKNLIIEYNPGFDAYEEGNKDRYAGLPIVSYKVDFYVYGLSSIDRYCRILDFSTLNNTV